MKTKLLASILAAAGMLASGFSARAVTNNFFNASQTAIVTASNMTAVTINSGGYVFKYSVDGYWAPYAGGTPTGERGLAQWH